MRLVKLSERMGGIGLTFCRSGWDLLNFLKAWVKLVMCSIKVDGISHTFGGVGEISQTF